MDYTLSQLVQHCTEHEQTSFLIHDYDVYCNSLAKLGNELTVTISNFMTTASNYSLYDDSTKDRDLSNVIERLAASMKIIPE